MHCEFMHYIFMRSNPIHSKAKVSRIRLVELYALNCENVPSILLFFVHFNVSRNLLSANESAGNIKWRAATCTLYYIVLLMLTRIYCRAQERNFSAPYRAFS